MGKYQQEKVKRCKHCQTEIPYKAKVCPQCRKKVKGGFAKWLVIALAVFLILAGMGGEESEAPETQKVGTLSQNTEEGIQQTVEETPQKTAFCVGDIIQEGDIRIVYMSSGEYVEENPYSQPEEGYKYIYLQFAFENTSDNSDASVSSLSFEGYADGYAVEMYYGGEEDLSATMSAGRTVTGCVYFVVPENAAEIEIEYTPNMFLEKKLKFIYEGEKDSGYVPVLNTTATEDAYQVGDVVESSQLRISYLSCEPYESDNAFVQPKDGFRYITCTFEFENLDDTEHHVSYYDFYCYADGAACDGNYLRDDGLSATLSSGRKAKGTVTFEVPVDAAVIEVEYLSNFWTSNRVVFAAK